MTLGKVSPGYYVLKQATLIAEFSANRENTTVDISGLIPAITINEAITATAVSGAAVVYDTVGLLERFPLRGEERLLLELQDAIGNSRIYDMFVYKVDNVQVTDTNDRITYTIHFVSYQSFFARNQVHIRSFKNSTVSDIVTRLFNDTYGDTSGRSSVTLIPSAGSTAVFNGVDKQLTVEPTEGFVRIAIPRMNTLQAMDFLARRAFSNSSASSSFRFFESSNRYMFVSDEWLYKNSQQQQRIFVFTCNDKIPKDGSAFVQEINNLESVTNSHRFDSIDDITGGTYHNRVIELDVINKTANLKQQPYKYFDNRQKYFTNLFGDVLQDRHTEQFIAATTNIDNARQFLVFKDYSSAEETTEFQIKGTPKYSEIVSNRLAFRKHLNSIQINAVGPGRYDIVAGDIVDLQIPEFNSSSERSVLNPQLSGKFIVKSISRMMEADNYKNYYTLIKMNWSPTRELTTSARIFDI